MKIDLSNPVNRSHPLNRGLVSWWLALPGQQRGVMFRDLCGKYHGTLTNMDPATDWVGPRDRTGGSGALDFDGSNDFVTAAISKTAVFPYSFGAWARPAATTDGSTFLSWIVSGSGTVYSSLEIRSSKFSIVHRNEAFSNAVGTTTVVAGTWYRVDGVYNSDAECLLYVNGVLEATLNPTNGAHAPNVFLIGKLRTTDSVGIYTGMLDDVTVYDRTRSAAEVRERYNLSRQGYPGLLNRVRRPYYSVQDAVVGDPEFGLIGGKLIRGGMLLRGLAG